MKTLEEIENEYAKEQGWLDFNHVRMALTASNILKNWIPEICKRYSIEVSKAALENAAKNTEVYFGNPDWFVDKNPITDERNIPKI